MRKSLIPAVVLSICGAFTSSFAVLEIPNEQPKVDEAYWNTVLDKTWDGLKKRNIAPYENGNVGPGLIHRPKSEDPGDAVSEAVGYGMLVALYANDQETFNKIWASANKNMWNGKFYDWQLKTNGGKSEGAATDAEEDIILSLLFAQKLVDAGKWQDYEDPNSGKKYLSHAKRMMKSMWDTEQITSNGILAPGAGWGGYSFVNVGYFSPAWYKIFAKYDPDHNWNSVADKSYEIISKSPAYNLGMVPDWMTPSGGYVGKEGLGYNAYFESKAFYKDAIRILWRVAIDVIWFGDARGKEFLQNAMTFINGKGGASAANFFQMDGQLLPETDVWTDMKGGTITRHRREHSPLTISMYMTAAMAAGTDEDKMSYSLEMAKFYDKDADYFGLSVDPSGAEEDTLHNEMYFEQFLGWFGTSLMTGVFCNLEDDLTNPKTNVAGLQTVLSKPEDPKDTTTVILANAKKPSFSISRSGKTMSFMNSESAHWTIYSMNGQKIASMEGASVSWETQKSGSFLVKMTDSRNLSQVKHFIVP